MTFNQSHVFNRSGIAALSDLQTSGWRELFAVLENEQKIFLERESDFRSAVYKWPRDPLHTWSRIWEYPYVYYHLQRIKEQSSSEKLEILDYGSGVTFFPFSVAKFGCGVLCVDIDPICAIDIPAAAKIIQHRPGAVSVALLDNGRIPVNSESQDVVYCISVIEHVPNFESVIDEINRVLKPRGHFILTVDIDLRGNFEMGIEGFERLQGKLKQYFVNMFPEQTVHPSNFLTTSNSPYPMMSRSPLYPIKQILKYIIRGQFIVGDPRAGLFLSVYSGVYSRI